LGSLIAGVAASRQGDDSFARLRSDRRNLRKFAHAIRGYRVAKGKQRKVDLPKNWWRNLVDLCRSLWEEPKGQAAKARLDIYAFTKISKRSFDTAKSSDQMTEQLFLRLAVAVGYASQKDLLQALGQVEPDPADEWSAPPDLLPPPAGRDVRRPRCRDRLQELANSYLAVVVQGPPNCGKSALARDLFDQAGDAGRHLLWCSLLPGALLGDLLERLKVLGRPLITSPGQEIPDLISWLHSANVVLVLDGFDQASVNSFGPLLQRCAKLAGPVRLIATSAVRLTDDNIYDVPPLSAEELSELTIHLGSAITDSQARTLVSETELWPYAIEKALTLFGSIDSLTLARASKMQVSEFVHRLPVMDRRVVEALSAMGSDFDLPALGVILDALGCKEAPDAVSARLRSLFLLRQVSEQDWRLERSGLSLRGASVTDVELVALLERVSRHFEARALRPGRPRDPWTADELSNLYKASRLLQIANRNSAHRLWLLQHVSRGMEPLGLHDRLRVLYEYEANDARDAVGWIHFKYARSLHVTGRLETMLEVCDKAFHYLANPKHKEGRDEDLYISFLGLLSRLLIDVGQGALALQILDGALEAAEIAELSSTVGMQTVSILGWALLRTGMTKEYLNLNERVLSRPFGHLIQPFPRALSETAAGVAHISQGKYDEGIIALATASEFFKTHDIRAYAWSTLHLADAYRAAGRAAEAQQALLHSIETNAARNFFGPDLGQVCSDFLASTEYEGMHPALRLELARSESYEAERSRLALSIADHRLVEHILLEHAIEPGTAYGYDPGKYELFSEGRPYPIKSRFNQNLISRIRKENVEEMLDVLFGERKPLHIFRIHIYNRIIVNACKDIPLLAKKFIYPHLDIIRDQMDGVLFVYARYFEGVGADVATAQLLLNRVRNRDCFNYYNVSANCIARTDFAQAMQMNEMALTFARARQQKAQMQHNMANLIFSHRERARFPEALELCEASIRNTTKVNFHWPKNLMLKLRLLRCDSDDDFERVLDEHRQRFHVTVENLRKICSELDAGRVRRLSLSTLDKPNAL
jgi:tetratricopeptide (TPR) repeat protein